MCDKDIAVRQETTAVAPVTDKTLSDYLQAFGLANQLSKQETAQFVEIAKAYQLNPFKREIYCLPYGHGESRRLSIIVGYEVYLKRADMNPFYDGYETSFGMENGSLTCTCKVYRKDRKVPTSQTVSMKEYSTGKSLWVTKPRTMLEKVAIATAFRRAFPSDMGGMPYTKEEIAEAEPRDVTPAPAEEAPQAPPEATVAEIQTQPAEPAKNKATPEQTEKLTALAKAFTKEELVQMKAAYGSDIELLIKKMSEARLRKLDEGTLHQGAGDEQKHAWASPKVAEALNKTEAPEQFADDSGELYR